MLDVMLATLQDLFAVLWSQTRMCRQLFELLPQAGCVCFWCLVGGKLLVHVGIQDKLLSWFFLGLADKFSGLLTLASTKKTPARLSILCTRH